MENTKFIKWRFFFSGIRLLYLKLKFFNKINISSLGIFIDSGIRFRIDRGTMRLAHKVWIGRNSTILVRDGAAVCIGERTYLSDSVRIVAYKSIQIGSDCLIADTVSIYDHDHCFERTDIPIGKQGFVPAQVEIGNDVWIGSHCVVCKGVRIGDGAIVGAGSVVTKNIESYTINAGIPAKTLRKRERAEKPSNPSEALK